ncbi:1702_t:CDS:2, partial [Entrophospora sp. SA101]
IDGMMDAKLHQQILHGDLMNTIKDHGFNVKEATDDTSVDDSSIDPHHAFNDISNITLPFKRSKT